MSSTDPYRPSPIRMITTLALCTALVFGLQVALAAIPNGETVTLFLILFTLYFRWRTLYIIYAFAILEGLTYGFSVWWIVYLYIWTILWALVMLLGRRRRPGWAPTPSRRCWYSATEALRRRRITSSTLPAWRRNAASGTFR